MRCLEFTTGMNKELDMIERNAAKIGEHPQLSKSGANKLQKDVEVNE